METKDYAFILKFTTLVISSLFLIFGFYLILKNNKVKSGQISFGSFSIKSSTAGLVFVFCGTIILLYYIVKGIGMTHKEEKKESKITLDPKTGDTLEIWHSSTIVMDSATVIDTTNNNAVDVE